MFGCKSAWFSGSVPEMYRNFWTLEGGTISTWRTADYLFSADATCLDTRRIFESKDYLWNKVTVFHSLFLSACEKRQSVKSVCIGHYVLPPAFVQDEVRTMVGRFIWEREDEQSVGQDSHESGSHPTEDEYGEEEEVSKKDSDPSDTDSDSEVSLGDHSQHFPASSMLAGYVSMDNLPKYSGDLCDFYPGCFRCAKCKALCFLPLIHKEKSSCAFHNRKL
ncbi:telomere repeats-binding bouquet formation protein 2 isoform X2 [Brachyistius frenatus]|uniref:telomere repeats-binding bouquet formation protein 2 isoform X2 n=1 Tax=Brachyistius frenatus TaxID=100188 RepID=UPI0037E7D0C9